MAGTRSDKETKVSERASHFLKALVEHYSRDGQPVGSRTLAKETGLDLSPATVRNVMSDLEDMGLVSSPHTSAGRVPTLLGYRLFVDSLLTIKPLNEIDVAALQAEFEPLNDAGALVDTASRLLSGVTHLAGVVMLPRHERDVFRQIELLPLSGKKVLAILVTGEGEVHNRIIHTERPISPAQLVQASNFLTELFTGQDMGEVRKRLLEDLRITHQQMDALLRHALEMAQRVMESAEHKDQLRVSGQTNLMQFDELASMDRLKALFEAFNEKREILYLLDRCIQAEGVQIFFGGESGYEVLDDCSLVTTPYRVDGEVLGVLGVIGPTRMDYQRVIPVVDVTARLLAAALRQHN
ncbi:heat-inducible transcriptional repressor HrcA [Thiorhodovibrio frisius]|uniref:Heat-inducible transcription repressor HrcA n=1 Tax=Thiorhodovibrio frisius TaxID=631362 RepID=H8YXT0_9GAMM|nr:heat-inducible transcriptional repressor HrcA [Thiorhodovibrio frisius]EIC23256.1 heat shock gene repressor HrcA [Thiorhodovibrio frisius]WPL23668.1 Heat-inducible transcription repressor HrcA [Thiorhodovibrio frisius]